MKLKEFVIILLIVVLFVFLMFILNKIKKSTIFDGPGMEYKPNILSLYYNSCGAELDSYTRIDLGDGSFTLDIRDGKTSNNTMETYNIGIDFYNRLDDIISKYNVKTLTNLEKLDVPPLDGENISLGISFQDGVKIEINSNMILPENSKGIFKDIYNLFIEESKK